MEKIEKFRISGIGIDTSNFVSGYYDHGDFQYIYTSLSANNEFQVRGIGDSTILVVGTNYLDDLDIGLAAHMKGLGRTKAIDLLVIPGSGHDYQKYGELLWGLMTDGVVNNIGIEKPESLDKLKESIEKLDSIGIKVGYITLDICPYHFDYQMIKWCHENGIKIFGFNPFGGNRSSACMIESFTVPYLLSFISVYSDIVFLSSRNIQIAEEEFRYLSGIIGEDVEPKFILRKNVNKLVKSLGKVITCDLKINDKFIVPLDLPEYAFPSKEIRLNFGDGDFSGLEEEVLEFDTNRVEDLVYDLFLDTHKPEDGDDLSFLSILRPKIYNLLKEDGCDAVFQSKVGKNVYMFFTSRSKVVKTPWYKKNRIEEEKNTYILYYKGGKFLFRDYENARKRS